MTDLSDIPASDLLAMFRTRQTSPAEVWADIERRIAAWEPSIAALWAYDPESARADAAAATERWAKGAPKGPLDGVPVTIKDLIATKGTPVPNGTAATTLVPAPEDAPPAARLREDGAIIFAKTTCPDYGMLSSGLSSFHKLSRNPWDIRLNPGGSSAGAAAAAAAGLGPLHLGTDIGGSIRIPAGLTGTVGFKPSYGRVPIDPTYIGRVAGPMTRTVADAALMMATLSRPDVRDPTGLPPSAIDWSDFTLDPKGLRIGVMAEAGCGLSVDPDVSAALADCARALKEAGAVIEPIPGILTRAMLDGFDHFFRARFWATMSALPDDKGAMVLPYIREWAAGAAVLSGTDVAAAFDQIQAIKAAAAAPFARFDAILSPVNPQVSWPAEAASPIDDPARPFEHIAFTLPWNVGEQPAISVNGGFTGNGLPIGVQIVGPRYADGFVLMLAALLTHAVDAQPRWASLHPSAA